MVKYLFLVAGLLSLAGPATAGRFDHSAWDAVLKARVNALGEVDYEALASDRGPLDAYLAQIAERSPDSHPADFPAEADRLAYWLNAYNALTLRGVLDNYPIGSIREAGSLLGFFRKKDYPAGGEVLSLNQIEHGIIRKRFREPRIHFALVCASVSCPRLDRDAFAGATLDKHLDRLTRQFVAEARNFQITSGGEKLVLSKIFDWYSGDFENATGEKGASAFVAYLKPYLPATDRARLEDADKRKPAFRDYDWSLNKPGSRASSHIPEERDLATSIGTVTRLAGS